jgi:circadian clock protein KaiC
VLSGGLFKSSLILIAGPPGTGKTIFGSQIAFHHVAGGGRAVYATVLTESHGRMIANLSSLGYFDPARIPDDFYIVSAYSTLASEGVDGLAKLLRRLARQRSATMLVLDGIATVQLAAKSALEFQCFLLELHASLSIVGCTTVLLGTEHGREGSPENAIVDATIHLRELPAGMRTVRELCVSKLRGSERLGGRHVFELSNAGACVLPRLESVVSRTPHAPDAGRKRMSFGIAHLDEMLRGGIMQGSSTMLLGAPGSGKTLLGLSLLAAGARGGERCFYTGFYESPARIVARANGIGLGFGDLVDRGLIGLAWAPPLEGILDNFAYQLLERVRHDHLSRVFIDGIDGLRSMAAYPERLGPFFIALSDELRALGVTLIVSEETDLFRADIQMPIHTLSAMIENIIFLRYVEIRAHLRRLVSILKVRESDYDSSLREFTISPSGIDVGATFASSEWIMTGHARSVASPGQGAPPAPRGER